MLLRTIPRRIAWLIFFVGILVVVASVGLALVASNASNPRRLDQALREVGGLIAVGGLWVVVGMVLLWWMRSLPQENDESHQKPERQLAEIQTAYEARFAALEARLDPIANIAVELAARVSTLSVPETAPETLSKRIDALQQELHSRLDPLGDLNSRAAKLDETLIALHTDVDHLRHRLDQWDDQTDRLENAPASTRELDAELSTLSTGIQDAHKRLDRLGDAANRVQWLEKQLDGLYVTLQDLHRRIDGLEKRK